MSDDDETPVAPTRVRKGMRDRALRPVQVTPVKDLGAPTAALPSRIGRYAVLRRLGQGGMGVVYAARDEQLDRMVAVKTILNISGDENTRKRFWREARAAASVSHPNVCPIYEVGEDGGAPFLAMELLEGEPLSTRLHGGALSVAEAVQTALCVLSALGALHARGIVHRDLKPSNIFLTPHGPKLLDFGLARPASGAVPLGDATHTALTRTGMLVGTAGYMAPEQVRNEDIDERTDLFAMGAILFESLSGKPAFPGKAVVEVLYATLGEQPPALSGSPAIAAVDRVIRKALAKAPANRYPAAENMAADLRSALLLEGTGATARASALTRLVVLPFRALKPDPEIDFLTFSLPDAVSTSLSGFPALVVRSSVAASRFAGANPDLKAIAAECDVDRILTGTLLHSGDRLRVSLQLTEVPAGTLLWSHTADADLRDVFALQDELSRSIVGALALPLGRPGPVPRRDVPASARAYEFYLRGNELGRRYDQLSVAKDLYLQCLEEDPNFAPAWAQLGRCDRVIGKYFAPLSDYRAKAEAAFKRALELNPDQPLAHKYFTNLEAELGHAPKAMVRLLGVARANRNDAEIFAGLVLASRYCGLFEVSMAAHNEAKRLDPHVHTSRDYTLLLMGDLGPANWSGETSSDTGALIYSLALHRRNDEARDAIGKADPASLPRPMRLALRGLLSYVSDPPAAAAAALEEAIAVFDDPEAIFVFGWLLAAIGLKSRALELVGQAVDAGYLAVPTLGRESGFDTLRGDAAFHELVRRAEAGRERAVEAFRDAGGESLLGIKVG